MDKNLIVATEAFVKKQLANEGTGHDWWHIQRVRNNAKLINKTEKADMLVIDLALLLHDVGDRKVIKKEDDDYSIAENFLKKQKVAETVIEQVMFIIKNISFAKSLHTKNKSIPLEFYVARDADRLDAVGAIGIARTFTYGGSISRLIYDPTKPIKKIVSYKDYKKGSISSLHHFDEKLLKLKDLMNTKTAKKIASDRDRFMRLYVKQFLQEWNGLK